MKRLLLTAVAGVSLVAAATAFAGEGYITANVSLRAGPDSGYPAVMRLRAGTPVMIEGCVDGWSWCDVSLGDDRGWVSGAYLQEEYDGRRVLVRDYGVRIGVPIVSFVFGDYWDHYYRGRSWYGSRERWSHVQPRYYRSGSYGGSYGHSGGSYDRSGGSYGHSGAYSGTRNSTTTYRDTQRVDSRISQPAYSSGNGTRHSGTVTTTTQPTYQTRQAQSTYQAAPSHNGTSRQQVTTETRSQRSSVNSVNHTPAAARNIDPPRSASGEQHSAAGQQRAAEVHDRNVARAQQRQDAAPSGSDHGNKGNRNDKSNDKGKDKGNRDDKGREQN